jgi:hypothetical protein
LVAEKAIELIGAKNSLFSQIFPMSLRVCFEISLFSIQKMTKSAGFLRGLGGARNDKLRRAEDVVQHMLTSSGSRGCALQ